MTVYFCGNDNFGCCSKDSEGQCVPLPTLVEPMYECLLRWDLMFFRKTAEDYSWYVTGLGVDKPKEVFSKNLRVHAVSLTSKTAIGLSSSDEALFRINFDYVDGIMNFILTKIVSNGSVKIIGLTSNDKNVFGFDDHGGVYEIDTDVNLRWRLENVSVKKLSCSYDHFVAISDTGALYTWGNGLRGQLGLQDPVLKCDTPTRIEFFDDLPSVVTSISCGGYHTLALTSDGDVYSWGWNESFQLGHSSDKVANYSTDPYPIDLGSRDDPIIAISAGGRHSVCLLKSRKVFTWGLNKQGQLGTGDTENRAQPTELNHNFESLPTKISCGRFTTFIFTD